MSVLFVSLARGSECKDGVCAVPNITAPTEVLNVLTIGDPAPSLPVHTWFSGQPVDVLNQGRVHVVEFWATWCGPCVSSALDHMNGFAERLSDQVAFLAVAGEEQGGSAAEDVNVIENSLKKHPFSSKISVGYVLPEVSQAWQGASLAPGVPNAYIVDNEGRIAWIGLPEDLDEPLQQVLQGQWDIHSARQARESDIIAQKKENDYRDAREELVRQDRWADVLALTENYLSEQPVGPSGESEMHIFDLTITDALVKLGRLDQAVASILKWKDDFTSRDVLDYVEPLIGHPEFQLLLKTRLEEMRDFISRLLQLEDKMKDFAYVLTRQMADVEATVGDPKRAMELNRITLKYLPEQSPHFTSLQLQTMRKKTRSALGMRFLCHVMFSEESKPQY